MDLKISFEKAEWNKSPHGSEKECVVVMFPNCAFKWMPTYEQLEAIRKALDKVEQTSWGKQKYIREDMRK